MESTRLSAQIRNGFRQALEAHPQALAEAQPREPALRDLDLAELPKLVRHGALPASGQDALLAAVIRCYRRGPQAVWGPVLLEMLAPSVIAAATAFRPVPPTILVEDIGHQLIVEVLAAARSMPLPEPLRWAERRLMMRACWTVSRWLTEAVRGGTVSLDALAGHAWHMPLRPATGIGIPRGLDPDLELLYRHVVLGERLADLAAEEGLSIFAILRGCRRAMERLRCQYRRAA